MEEVYLLSAAPLLTTDDSHEHKGDTAKIAARAMPRAPLTRADPRHLKSIAQKRQAPWRSARLIRDELIWPIVRRYRLPT